MSPINLKNTAALFLVLLATTLCANDKPNYPKGFSPKTNNGVVFTENKGQVHDQHYKSRPDVLFSGTDGHLTFHLKNNGISYQLCRVDTWKKESDLLKNPIDIDRHNDDEKLVPDQSTIYRLDINWLNANTNAAIQKQNPLDGFNNYYLENCPDGALNVKSYQQILYQNIYSGIDLKWYEKEGHLEYDYLVSAGADYKKIQFEINGAEKISINKKGDLIFKTPLGDIMEQAPLVKQNGKLLKSKWVLTKNILSFDIQNINVSQPFIIDPVIRAWGTYYGGTDSESLESCATDATGNVYLAGYTSSSGTANAIATIGSHQSTFGGGTISPWGGGIGDAFLVKFSGTGVRQWSTYYGGIGNERGNSCATDATGNVYLAGITSSSVTAIATLGSHQYAYGGGVRDAFLVKFNSSGVRQWGTYYGGDADDFGESCAVDAIGNVYLAGKTTSSVTAIATMGSHQSTYGTYSDAYLVKFNSAGVRQWGTYYGGNGIDDGFSCATDALGNVYMTGITISGTSIATMGSHQTAYGGGPMGEAWDAFLVKFNSSGVRQWGTYYGSNGSDYGRYCAVDATGNVYLSGSTTSSVSSISTLGSHQSTFGGDRDAFLVKFNSAGARQWGTYYGGIGYDLGLSCSFDVTGNVYMAGMTSSSITAIATGGSYQSTFGGGSYDSFLVKFNSLGVQQWGTYYGGIAGDSGGSCATDASGNVYLAGGTTSSLSAIATTGSHQSGYGGGSNDAFLVKFIECVSPTITVSSGAICSGKSFTIVPSGASTYTYSSGSAIVTPTASTSYSVVGTSSLGCVSSNTAITTVTVIAKPTVIVNNGSICSGKSFTMAPSGASTYSYSSGSAVMSPTINTTYTVIGTSAVGCTNTAISSVTVNPKPIVAVNSGSICSGKSFTMIPTGASTYIYSSGSAVISPTINTSYSVIGTSSLGCVSSNTAVSSVTVIAKPTVAVNSGSICSGKSFTMIPTGASTYIYSSGSAVISPTINTSYTVTGSSVAGCTNTAVSSVTVIPKPTVLALTTKTLICIGNSAVLSASTAATSYTWNTGATTMSVSVSPTVTSTYTVNVSNAAACVASSTVMVTVNACAGINELINNSIAIYPNPNNGEFTIELNEITQVIITNILGSVLLHTTLNTGKQTLDIKNHANGIYFVQLIIDGKQQTIKLIKE